MLKESAFISSLRKFDQHPFRVKIKNQEYLIGDGEPTFTVRLKDELPVSDLLKSTSLTLGEAYMDGNLEIEGDLYNALDHFMGQMGKGINPDLPIVRWY